MSVFCEGLVSYHCLKERINMPQAWRKESWIQHAESIFFATRPFSQPGFTKRFGQVPVSLPAKQLLPLATVGLHLCRASNPKSCTAAELTIYLAWCHAFTLRIPYKLYVVCGFLSFICPDSQLWHPCPNWHVSMNGLIDCLLGCNGWVAKPPRLQYSFQILFFTIVQGWQTLMACLDHMYSRNKHIAKERI